MFEPFFIVDSNMEVLMTPKGPCRFTRIILKAQKRLPNDNLGAQVPHGYMSPLGIRTLDISSLNLVVHERVDGQAVGCPFGC